MQCRSSICAVTFHHDLALIQDTYLSQYLNLSGITTNPVSIRSLNDADDTVLAEVLETLVKEAKAFGIKLSAKSTRAKVLAAWNDLVASVVHKDWTSVKEAALLLFLQANGVKYTKSNRERERKAQINFEFSFIFGFRQSCF